MLKAVPGVFAPTKPFIEKSTTESSSRFPSVSFAKTPFAAVTFRVTSSLPDFVSGFATGGKGETGTVTVTVAVSVPPFPSDIS